jgi:hypothetical protein
MNNVLKLQTLRFSSPIWAPSEGLVSGFSGVCPTVANDVEGQRFEMQ